MITTLADLAKRIGADMNYCAIAAQTGKLETYVRMAVLDYGASNVIGAANGKVIRAGECFEKISGVDVETGKVRRAKKAKA